MNAKAILGLLALGTVALSLRGRRHRSVSGLGLDPEQHGVNRSTLATAAGFRIRDARRAARNGWCDSALTLLRDAEYHAGQVTAHAKSIPGKPGEGQRRKAQALRVAVNQLARDLKQSCSIHRRRPPAGPRNQGKLPFDR